jgi:hypothetical protein
MSLATDQRVKEAWTEIRRLQEALAKAELRLEFLESAVNAFARVKEPSTPHAYAKKTQ